MGYDFHYDAELDQLSLIEINTNSSAFLISDLIYQTDPDFKSHWPASCEKLMASFKSEASHGDKDLKKIAIIDEAPSEQKMYIEFLMFKEFFKSFQIDSEIYNYEDTPLNESVSLVYNRYNDFSLKQKSSSSLRQAYLNGVCFSPNPKEYLKLADKSRLNNLSEITKNEVFIPSRSLKSNEDWDALWEDRKKYIIKPLRLYGAKAVYRGGSISRTKYDSLRGEDFMAQEYRPPGMHNEWKFDLRFYVYGDEIQLGIARLFQGQVLNFSNLGGGLGRIRIRP
jgi:hypothetical protein